MEWRSLVKSTRTTFLIMKAPKMGSEEREGLQPSHTSSVTSYTRMCIHLSTSLPLYEISNTYIPASDHVLFSWRSVLAFLERLDRAFGGWPSASGFIARSSKASLMVWYESVWRARRVHSMARACREL